MDPSGESRKYKNISRRLLLFAGESDKIHKSSEKGRRNPYGIVAQLGERRVRNAEVEGSSPFGSTKRKPGRKGRVFLLAGLFKGARTGACKKTARGAVFPRPDRARRARERAPSVPPKENPVEKAGFFFWPVYSKGRERARVRKQPGGLFSRALTERVERENEPLRFHHQVDTKKMYPAQSPILSGFFAARKPRTGHVKTVDGFPAFPHTEGV